MKKKAKRTAKKEEIAEDWCFVCKDGGELRVCDYKDCLKAYHPICVEKDDSFLESGSSWKCMWHSCYVPKCHKASNFQCYCCPNSVCRRCIKTAEFVHVKGKKGFCNHCLKLALLVEEKKDVDSDGETVDFKDRETYEGLFREYWEIINEKEGLTMENLVSANTRYQMSKNYNSDSDGSDNVGTNEVVSDYDDSDDAEEAHKPALKRKRSKGQLSSGKEKLKTSKTKFIGWGSVSILQFLQSIGKDTTRELSQREVTNIVSGYIKENKLLDLQRKKIVVCDERLQSILGRKTVNKHRIYDLLEAHFAANQEQSQEEELGYNSEDKDEDVLVACKRHRKSTADRISQREEKVLDIPRFYFASIIPENIKLVYLKRSLVLVLSQEPETFESKVLGSFVRVKLDPNECFQKNCYQLVQVTGIKKRSVDENDQEIFLLVSDMYKDISFSTLSDDEFSEEECLDLKKKVKSGLLKKLTVDGVEQKARSLHEDIIKHWIPRELSSLQNRIDRANEKGWRRELFEYLERKQKLQNPAEQSRLLQQVPKVIADVEELGPAYEDTEDKKGDEGSPKSILMGTSVIPDVAVANGKTYIANNVFGSVEDEEKNGQAINVDTAAIVTKDMCDEDHKCRMYIYSYSRRGRGNNPRPAQIHNQQSSKSTQVAEKRKHQGDESSLEGATLEPETPAQEGKLPTHRQMFVPEVMQTCLKAYVTEALPEKCGLLDCKDLWSQNACLASSTKKQAADVEPETVKSAVFIDLSSDDDGHDKSSAAIEKQRKLEDHESNVWHCLGPNGERNGPLSLKLLKAWSQGTPYASKFKVWKANQSEAAAIPLMDAVNLAFQ